MRCFSCSQGYTLLEDRNITTPNDTRLKLCRKTYTLCYAGLHRKRISTSVPWNGQQSSPGCKTWLCSPRKPLKCCTQVLTINAVLTRMTHKDYKSIAAITHDNFGTKLINKPSRNERREYTLTFCRCLKRASFGLFRQRNPLAASNSRQWIKQTCHTVASAFSFAPVSLHTPQHKNVFNIKSYAWGCVSVTGWTSNTCQEV